MFRIVKTTTLGVAIVGITAFALSQQYRFTEERIELSLSEESSFRVRGEYVFVRAPSAPHTADSPYPFPVDTIIDYPTDVSLTVEGDTVAVRSGSIDNTIVLPLNFERRDTCKVVVAYTQQTRSRIARYILTTTHLWGRPLDRAAFTIDAPRGRPPTFISYPCETVEDETDRVRYGFSRTNFMPNRDLMVEW